MNLTKIFNIKIQIIILINLQKKVKNLIKNKFLLLILEKPVKTLMKKINLLLKINNKNSYKKIILIFFSHFLLKTNKKINKHKSLIANGIF